MTHSVLVQDRFIHTYVYAYMSTIVCPVYTTYVYIPLHTQHIATWQVFCIHVLFFFPIEVCVKVRISIAARHKGPWKFSKRSITQKLGEIAVAQPRCTSIHGTGTFQTSVSMQCGEFSVLFGEFNCRRMFPKLHKLQFYRIKDDQLGSFQLLWLEFFYHRFR